MQRSYYQEYFFFEQDNWWFVSRRRILMSLLRKSLGRPTDLEILDAGCGTGINLAYLEEFGRVTGVDIADEAIRFCLDRGHERVRQGNLVSLPWPDAAFDLVTMLDVLEHLEDDEAAIREAVRVTRPVGHLLVTVPAFPSLRSEHDEVNQHRRRYRARELRRLVTAQGCEIHRFTHMNAFLLPVAWTVRTLQRIWRSLLGPPRRPPKTDFVDYHPVLNGLLTMIFTAETPLITWYGLPVGLSLPCLATKR